MFADEVISQAVTRHFGGPVESGICFGIPRHHLKRNGRVVPPKNVCKLEKCLHVQVLVLQTYICSRKR